MTPDLTDEQQMLRDSAVRFLEKHHDFAARGRLLAGGDDGTLWRQMAELGWIGACLAEDRGGFGGPAEAAVLMQEFGRRLVTQPLLESAIVGGQLIAAMPGPRRDELLDRLMAGDLQVALAATERHSRHALDRVDCIARTSASGWRISGTKTMVAQGDRADLLFVTARVEGGTGLSLFAVPTDSRGLSRRNFRLHDGRGAAEITLSGCELDGEALVGDEGQAFPIVSLAVDHGSAALCAEAVGSADHVLAATIEYLKTRVQYGAPLARLQVLQHRLAEMFVAAEQARVMAAFATEALSLPEAERASRVSAARVAVDDYTGFVRRQAVQLHGGMGVSEELDIAHHLKRAMVAGQSHGDASYHLSRYMHGASAHG